MSASGCWFEGCGKTTTAGGLCSKHYKQDRRGTLGSSRQLCAPGEGAQVCFRVSASLKKLATRLAKKRGVDTSEVYREALEKFLDRAT